MKYFIVNPKKDLSNSLNKSSNKPINKQNQIPLTITSKYYSQLCIFEYIGVKYYNYTEYDNEDENLDKN